MIPGKLTVRADGRVIGPASITYNDPFPCVNGSWGSGAMQGVVMHTMVGNLPGTIALFNDPARGASAYFGIDQLGNIHQFGPIGKGWIAWAEVAGNLAWYSIEHADNGNPDNPLTQAQIVASAQLVEMLSAFAGFPLQVTDSTDGQGYGTHFMGGAAWGGHTCPDLPPRHVRSGQRAPILALALLIRDATVPGRHVADGTQSMLDVAVAAGTGIADVLAETLAHEPNGPGPLLRRYLDAADLTAPMLEHMVYWLPA